MYWWYSVGLSENPEYAVQLKILSPAVLQTHQGGLLSSDGLQRFRNIKEQIAGPDIKLQELVRLVDVRLTLGIQLGAVHIDSPVAGRLRRQGIAAEQPQFSMRGSPIPEQR